MRQRKSTRTDAARSAPHKLDCACRPCVGRRRREAALLDWAALWKAIYDAADLALDTEIKAACEAEQEAAEAFRRLPRPEHHVVVDPVVEAKPARVARPKREPKEPPAYVMFCAFCGLEASGADPGSVYQEQMKPHDARAHPTWMEHQARRWVKVRPRFAAPVRTPEPLPEGARARVCLQCRKRIRSGDAEGLRSALANHSRGCPGARYEEI